MSKTFTPDDAIMAIFGDVKYTVIDGGPGVTCSHFNRRGGPLSGIDVKDEYTPFSTYHACGFELKACRCYCGNVYVGSIKRKERE